MVYGLNLKPATNTQRKTKYKIHQEQNVLNAIDLFNEIQKYEWQAVCPSTCIILFLTPSLRLDLGYTGPRITFTECLDRLIKQELCRLTNLRSWRHMSSTFVFLSSFQNLFLVSQVIPCFATGPWEPQRNNLTTSSTFTVSVMIPGLVPKCACPCRSVHLGC